MVSKTKRPRIARRSPTSATVTCQPYVSAGPIHLNNGELRNFSSEGCYIETSCEFNSGTILFIRTTRYPSIVSSTATHERPRSMCLAEVKWLRDLSDEETVRFGIGLRYLM
jgi:hypothetical protein